MEGIVPAGLSAFVLTATIIELTPGPNMAWIAIVAATDGRRAGFAAVAGVALGLTLVGLAAAFGLAALVAASPAIYEVLRWSGVLFLLWLAWDGWRDADLPDDPRRAEDHLAHFFGKGLLTNLLNPKAAVFFLAMLPTFVDAGQQVLPQTLLLSAIYVAVATVIHGGIVLLAGRGRSLFVDPDRSRAFRRLLSLLLAGVALWFAWSTGRPAAV